MDRFAEARNIRHALDPWCALMMAFLLSGAGGLGKLLFAGVILGGLFFSCRLWSRGRRKQAALLTLVFLLIPFAESDKKAHASTAMQPRHQAPLESVSHRNPVGIVEPSLSVPVARIPEAEPLPAPIPPPKAYSGEPSPVELDLPAKERRLDRSGIEIRRGDAADPEVAALFKSLWLGRLRKDETSLAALYAPQVEFRGEAVSGTRMARIFLLEWANSRQSEENACFDTICCKPSGRTIQAWMQTSFHLDNPPGFRHRGFREIELILEPSDRGLLIVAHRATFLPPVIGGSRRFSDDEIRRVAISALEAECRAEPSALAKYYTEQIESDGHFVSRSDWLAVKQAEAQAWSQSYFEILGDLKATDRPDGTEVVLEARRWDENPRSGVWRTFRMERRTILRESQGTLLIASEFNRISGMKTGNLDP